MTTNSRFLTRSGGLAAIGLGVFAAAFAHAQSSAQEAGPPSEIAPHEGVAPPVDRTIRDAFRDAFYLGTAGDMPGRYSDEELELAQSQFGFLTPENCMKPALVHPGEDAWRFDRSDALVDWCIAADLKIHGHTLVWHAQTNDWFFRDSDWLRIVGPEFITLAFKFAHEADPDAVLY